tara:strand:- start:1197 stop:1463 length:267 start_codon:yes stop_codon:yes gene_type:complete
MNKPYELTALEWGEIATVQEVVESFGLENEEYPAGWLADYAYGVRFDYQTDGPGYVGPLYLLQSSGAPETSPMAFIRFDGKLKVVQTW